MSTTESKTGTLSPEIKDLLNLLISSGQLEPYMNPSAQAEKSLDEMLEKNMNGTYKSSNQNYQLIMKHNDLLKESVRFNELKGQMDVVKDMPWKRFEIAFSQNDLDNIITQIEIQYGINNEKMIERAIRVISKENSYHPIRDELNSLVWDGENRLSHVLTKYLGVEATPLSIECLKVFMLGAISRVFTPGCKFEYMLCLVGGQGAGKSTFLRFLAMEDQWFTDDIRELNAKDIFERLNGHWILEIPEMLAVLQAKSVEETKSFISRLSDNYRIPYDKFAADHARQSVFAGTSNRIAFLPPDKSGNRRFLPIEVNTENAELHILENPTEARAYFRQLWAEVMEIYRTGDFKLTLDADMENELRMAQKKYMPEDPMETDIVNFIERKHPKYVCTKMLFIEALGHTPLETMETWQSNAIGEIMNQCFKKEYKKLSSHKFETYGVQRAWVSLAPSSEEGFIPVPPELEPELPFE